MSKLDQQLFLYSTGLAPLAEMSFQAPDQRGQDEHRNRQPAEWQRVRCILTEWMQAHGYSIRRLADAATLQPSVLSRFLNGGTILDPSSSLKLYTVLHLYRDEAGQERLAFLEAAGLVGHVSTFNQVLTVQRHEVVPIATLVDKLQMQGDNYVTLYRYEDALFTYAEAEELAGDDVPRAMRAATYRALTYTLLGYFEQAHAEIARITKTYAYLGNFEIEAKLCELRGWIAYYQGQLAEAEVWFHKCLHIARASGYAYLGEAALHFLGRVYFEQGRTHLQPQERLAYFNKAATYFDRAFQLHLGWSGDYGAYDLFRKAQLLHYQHNWRAAQQLRRQARHMFGEDLAYLVIDLEGAKLTLDEGNPHQAKRTALAVLDQWAAVKYFKEMMEPFRVLALAEQLAGRPAQAVQFYTLSLCMYPFAPSLNSQQWHEIMDLCADVARQEGLQSLRRLIGTIEEAVITRTGHFSYLSGISIEHEVKVAQVLHDLRKLV